MRNVCAITLFPIDPIISAFYYITPPHTHNMRSHIPRDLYLYIYVWFSSLYKSKMFIALWLGTFCKASSATTTTTTTTTNNATFFLFVSRNYTRKIEVHSTHSVHRSRRSFFIGFREVHCAKFSRKEPFAKCCALQIYC